MATVRPHWRKMTWTVVVFNVIMLLWVVFGVSSATHTGHCQNLSAQLCHDATDTGAAIGAGILIALWVAGDLILGVLWLVTRGRSCPACGRGVRRGVVVCRGCGHDMRTALSA